MTKLFDGIKKDDRYLLYLLTNVSGIGGSTLRKIRRLFPELEAVLYMEETELQEACGITSRQYRNLRQVLENEAFIEKSYAQMLSSGIRMVTIWDPEYPKRLLNIPDPPAVLYCRGELPPEETPAIAVVGSRAASNYGTQMAGFLSEMVAACGVGIVSGLAHGIDGAAHEGALRTPDGKTYGVLAGGVNVCYPRDHYPIFDAMATGGRGGVLSEMPLGASPLKQNFPMRNRIISGLADAVVIIEAREKSGSLITADLALEQGREILALPGRITDPLSRGCNNLIAMGARIITCPDDIMEVLGLIRNSRLTLPEKNMNSLAKEEKLVYSTLDLTPKYTQDIIQETKLPASRVLTILLELELKGYITQISGNYYGIS